MNAKVSHSLFLNLIFALLIGVYSCPVSAQSHSRIDYDGDGLGDLINFVSGEAKFVVRKSSDLQNRVETVGTPGDVEAIGDYDRDGKTDLVTFNRSTAVWSGLGDSFVYGAKGDWPVPGVYSSMDCMNLATYAPATGVWSFRDCATGVSSGLTLGGATSLPVPADYDCDGLDDPAVFNSGNSEWTVLLSSTGERESFFYGLPGDIPVPGAYLSASCDQPGVHRPIGNFYLIADGYEPGGLGNVVSVYQWGLPGDFPLLTSVDGDGLLDLAIFRPLDSSYYILTSQGSLFFQVRQIQTPSLLGQPLSARRLSLKVVPGDYNNDRKSDFVMASVDRTAGLTTFNVFHTGTRTNSSYQISAPGDAIVSADYSGDGTTDPAVVFVQPDGSLAWHTLDDIGMELVEVFGVNGDQPIAGDYDCDGKADKVVVRAIDGLKNWFFSMSSGELVGPIAFGFPDDTVHVADVDGDRCDEILISRQANGGIDWWYRDLEDDTPAYVQWGLATDEVISPADSNGDGRDDFHVSRNVGGARMIFSYLGSPGAVEIRNFVRADGALISGNFSGIERAEFAAFSEVDNSLAILRGDLFYDTEAPGLGGSVFLKPDGTVVQLGSTGGTPGDSGGDVDSGGGDNGGGDANTDSLQCDVVTDFFDGGGGALWKPVSESTGRPVILLAAEYWTATDSIQVFGNSGDVLANGTFRSCCPNDNRAHFDIPETANDLARDRPIVVRFNLKSGRKECRVVEDPRDRND